jgi:hypothetical protein
VLVPIPRCTIERTVTFLYDSMSIGLPLLTGSVKVRIEGKLCLPSRRGPSCFVRARQDMRTVSRDRLGGTAQGAAAYAASGGQGLHWNAKGRRSGSWSEIEQHA